MAVEEWYKLLREESDQFMRENQRQWDERQREWDEQRRIADERRRTESQIAVSDMEANMQKLGSKVESKFEALIELIRSMNGNSAASASAGSGVVGGDVPVREESWEASRPTSTNLDGRSVSGDRNRQEPRPEILKEAQTPEEASEDAEFRLQQLIASSKETERRMQQLYERNQQSILEYRRQCEEFWKQDELEERERNQNLQPELVDEAESEPELAPDERVTNLSQEINPNMHLIQDLKGPQHHCASSKVIHPPLQNAVAEVASKELGKLVDLLIELIEIRLANGRTSSMTDIGVCPMEFLETYDAQKLFVEIPREGSFFQIDVTSEAPWSGNRGDRCIAEELKALDHQFFEKFIDDRGVIEDLKGLPVKFVFSEVNSDLLMIVIVEDSNEMARFNGVLDEQIEIGDAYQVFVETPLKGIRRKWSSIQSGNTQSCPFPIIFDPGGSSLVLDCERNEGPGISIGVPDLGVNLLRLKSSQDCRILVPFDRGKASRDVLHKQLDFGRPTCGIMVVAILVFDPGIGVFEC